MSSNPRKLAFFPTPYPDELLYSTLARYYYYNPKTSFANTQVQLFSSLAAPSLKFASRLNGLCENLGGVLSPEEFLQRHTCYPFFSCFLTKKRQEYACQCAFYSASHLLSSVGALYLSEERWGFRYCPECLKEDLDKYGEGYFHVSHHLDGINVCPRHGVYLESYPLDAGIPLRSNYICFKPDGLKTDGGRTAPMSEQQLARLAGELLELSLNQYSLEDILEMLRPLLIQEGLATQKVLYHKAIKARLQEMYSQEFLEGYNLLTDRPWVYLLFSKNKLRHPLDCLVLISLVSESFKDFISKGQLALLKIKSFSQTSVCHNPFCRLYGLKKAVRVSIAPDGTSAIYRCSCGMVYRQFSDSFEHYSVVQYGELYGNQLMSLYEAGQSYSSLAETVHLSRNGVKKQLQAQNFTPVDRKLNEYKLEIETFLSGNPGLSRSELETKFNWSIRYFSKYDPQYLEHMLTRLSPPLKFKFKKTLPKDFSQEDEKYARQVEDIARELRLKEPPVWVSKRLLVSCLSPKVTISKIDHSLKKTRQALLDNTESRADFYKRELFYKIEKVAQNHPDVALTKAALVKIPGITYKNLNQFWEEIVTKFTIE